MSNGANYVHKELRDELANYIRTQYFGKSQLLMSALDKELEKEGVLFQKPFIESSPAYVTEENGIQNSEILPDWIKDYFHELSKADLGIFPTPYEHQRVALEDYFQGKDIFVSTGTGSGKTECFMWPLITKMAEEAKNEPTSWEEQSIRAVIMYPMNALVSDQVGRLRRLIGDPEDRFLSVFRHTCGEDARRPHFGMYTGRTPYAGPEPVKSNDRQLADTFERLLPQEDDSDDTIRFKEALKAEGRMPAKHDFSSFISQIRNGKHMPDADDAEYVTRFEMQCFTPDILITNYSMLEYMLLRPREKKIWADTAKWLKKNEKHKLLFIIDEAHMYRGSSGGEVALLIRRLFHKLGIDRSQVQFILTTASMPQKDDADREAVRSFAMELTAADSDTFHYLTGRRETLEGLAKRDIPLECFLAQDPMAFEGNESERMYALTSFWNSLEDDLVFATIADAEAWMYDHLVEYRPFYRLLEACRGEANSLNELASLIFPDANSEDAQKAVSVLIAIAVLAKDHKGTVLFPARMHMLFRGINGVYACLNEHCSHSHSEGSLTLGEITLSNGMMTCPRCGSVVHELYNDRRCGALFLKGYVLQSDLSAGRPTYLWRYPGQVLDDHIKEIHLYIPPSDYVEFKGGTKTSIEPCYFDVKNGYINFSDDSWEGKDGVRKLYYCQYREGGWPEVITFASCPHCRKQLSRLKLSPFTTQGNEPFYNLVKRQFALQPPVIGKDKDKERLPNQGRKVLLFSDSRQGAAKLARDMADASEISAAKQLFGIAISEAEKNGEVSMDKLYDYFCLAAAKHNVQLFEGNKKEDFLEHCKSVKRDYDRAKRRGKQFAPVHSITNTSQKYQEYLLRMFCASYNNLYDSAVSWLEPMTDALDNALDDLEDNGIIMQEKEFLEFFSAWVMYLCLDSATIGHSISDEVREEVTRQYGFYGLERGWKFKSSLTKISGYDENTLSALHDIFQERFLSKGSNNNNNELFYVDLAKIKPRIDVDHKWFRCKQCAGITPFRLKDRCPVCGSSELFTLEKDDLRSVAFWREPIDRAINGDEDINVIDIEEHTAQLSHKDQRNSVWSKTEEYEMRFQDLIKEGETPVDILSCTTTMEVGIDIGSLVAVGLRNIPPMRENYQQRAGRAGRRGASLSTIITYCGGGPHDRLYYDDPAPMFRGDPRRPWVDARTNKLIERHVCMVVLQEFLDNHDSSMDDISALAFINEQMPAFLEYLDERHFDKSDILFPIECEFQEGQFKENLKVALQALEQKCASHPELYASPEEDGDTKEKSLLDALYEEGIIPSYSFPKNVVSTYITTSNGRVAYEVERGLDVAIGEYAPGRAIVVDKNTYQIGGFYYPGSEKRASTFHSPARAFIEDPNYLKEVLTCKDCGWFGLKEDNIHTCPFCGSDKVVISRKMLRPWGFAPKNGRSVHSQQVDERYSTIQEPLYSTVPTNDAMTSLERCSHIKMAARSNQRIIMVNKGDINRGFMVCRDCGAAVPGDNGTEFKTQKVYAPYRTASNKNNCKHSDQVNVDLGYDFMTDMLVLEFELDPALIASDMHDMWLDRAAVSLAEGLRLVVCKRLDVDFMELVTGYRLRKTAKKAFVDIFIYDSLTSGAGYAVKLQPEMREILDELRELLQDCDCQCACNNCLKHYRNQYKHGRLDRFAALELLKWGTDGERASALKEEVQEGLIQPIANILRNSGCDLRFEGDHMEANGKRLVVYPAMWSKPKDPTTIYVRDIYLKNAKPHSVKMIADQLPRR